MDDRDHIEHVLADTTVNAVLAWSLVVVLAILVATHALVGNLRWAVFTAAVIGIIVWPALLRASATVMPPWYLIALFILPVLAEALAPGLYDLLIYAGVATAVLLLAVELHRLTAIRLSPTFAVVLVTLTTLAAAALWNMLLWLVDVTLDTAYILDGRDVDTLNEVLMVEFATATAVGLVAGITFEWAFRRRWLPASTLATHKPRPPTRPAAPRKRLADRIRLSTRTQERLVHGMQVVLVGLIVIGVVTGHVPTIVNAAISLGITFLPGIMEREWDLPMDPGLTLWITTAVFLHALGSAGLYDVIGPWDHLTHAFSASVVAAAGYAAMRAMQVHDPMVYIPRRLTFFVILVFVMAMGVIWELLEFVADTVAVVLDMESVLAQHGIHDTIVDLWFNAVGAVVVATWGAVYLLDVSVAIGERLYDWRQQD